MATPDALASAGSWMLESGHRTLLKLTGGRFPKKIAGMQTLELITIGRKSGERRPTLITSPICEPDRVILVASKGGHSEHPQWYKNLVAEPNVELVINDETRLMQARTASAEEKAELWPQLVAVYKGYDSYQRNSTRDIPVVICTPRDAE